ncbi:MAG: RNA-binding S4 domain-containing protein [Solobacterium sp.]|jgi:ribosome-associated protein|nr:RNA-binding S4 domain-containing protein [Solobacterium sp.]
MEQITTEYITLQQYLKFIGIADTGGQAKVLVKQLDIRVNGEKEDRRGKKLYPGDKVTINGKTYIVK